MHDLSVAFVWHQHQPYYWDDVADYNPMPWVRLHGAKDYWGLAMHLAEVPEVHATINLVPSLIAQILAYTQEKKQDEHLRVSRLPADGLSEAESLYILDNFFMANPEHMIRPFPRYRELYEQRGLHVDSAARALRRFSARDLVDLACWNNLVWFHPIAFEKHADLAEFRRKGSHYSEEEKNWLLDKQLEILAEVIPLHRKLAERGQLELTTTPFYHPILPLLVDKKLARAAMPSVQLPRRLEPYSDDAAEHVRRAVEYHERTFGMRPLGMWPAEGSVAQARAATAHANRCTLNSALMYQRHPMRYLTPTLRICSSRPTSTWSRAFRRSSMSSSLPFTSTTNRDATIMLTSPHRELRSYFS